MILKNVKAVITGAGSGLGEGTARYLKEKGAELLLIDLNADGLKKVANDTGAKYFVGDVLVFFKKLDSNLKKLFSTEISSSKV